MTPLMMTTSGTRGVIGDTMTPQVATKIAQAFGTYIGKGPVIVGGDTRVSYDMLNGAVLAGLISVGTDVINIGQCLTPTVQQMIRKFNAAGGVVITASHNPIQWNGIKLMNNTGSFMVQSEFEVFLKHYEQTDLPIKPWPELGVVTHYPNAIQDHVDLVLNAIDISPIKSANLNVLVDPNNGAGALANPILLEKLGVKATILNGTPDGRFSHDPEPLVKNLADTLAAAKTGRYDIGFVQDADADRLVILDENGHFIGEDYSLAFCIDRILQDEKTAKDPVIVVNLSTSQVLKDVAERHGAQLIQTKIGETNVTEGIKSHHAVAGGEGNGGVIYPKVGWGRDSLVGITLALRHLAITKKKVSEIVSTFPKYVMLRDKFNVDNRDQVIQFLDKVKQHYSALPQDHQDGVKISFPDGWVHARPSNTEPIVRVFVEAPSEGLATEILKTVRGL